MMNVRGNQQLAAMLIEASSMLKGVADARVSSRYLVAMTQQLIEPADTIALHVSAPAKQAFLTLGVYGYPHLGSTLITPFDSDFGSIMLSSEQIWARSPGEVNRLYDFPDDGTQCFARQLDFHASHAGAPHRSAIIQPCLFRDELLACFWIENHSEAGAFRLRDRERLQLIAGVTALVIADATTATVFDKKGISHQWDLRNGPISEPQPASGDDTEPDRAVKPLAPTVQLSEREQEVLTLLAHGNTNAEVAQLLTLSVNTVRTHRRNLMTKLDARNITELLSTARSLDLLQRPGGND